MLPLCGAVDAIMGAVSNGARAFLPSGTAIFRMPENRVLGKSESRICNGTTTTVSCGICSAYDKASEDAAQRSASVCIVLHEQCKSS